MYQLIEFYTFSLVSFNFYLQMMVVPGGSFSFLLHHRNFFIHLFPRGIIFSESWSNVDHILIGPGYFFNQNSPNINGLPGEGHIIYLHCLRLSDILVVVPSYSIPSLVHLLVLPLHMKSPSSPLPLALISLNFFCFNIDIDALVSRSVSNS